MTGDPANVGGTPVRILVVQIEYELMRHGHIGEVPTSGMQNAFGLACGTGCVQNKQSVLCIHDLWFAVCRSLRHVIVPPTVPTFLHLHLVVCAFHHDHVFNSRAGFQGFISGVLEPDSFTGAQGNVAGNE